MVAERNVRGKFAAKKSAVVEAAWEAPLAAFPAAVGLSEAELQGKVLPLELGAHYTLWFTITQALGFHNWPIPSSGFVGAHTPELLCQVVRSWRLQPRPAAGILA